VAINRRKLLAGAAAGAALPVFAGRVAHGAETDRTKFFQGALGGGGYSCGLSISNDGLTMVARSDTYGAYLYNRTTNRWELLNKSPNMDSDGVQWAKGGGIYDVAVAPGDSNRIYIVSTFLKANLVTFARGSNTCAVYRSDDRGITFNKTAMTNLQGGTGNRLNGPKLWVDPNNADIVYVANATGVFFVTYNGGANWSIVKDALQALNFVTVSASNAAPGNQRISINPDANAASAIKAGRSGGFNIYAYNLQHPQAVGQNDIVDQIITAVDKEILLTSWINSPGVTAGDQIYYGAGALVVIDGSSGTVPNPGIALGVPGASGVASKQIYFGWPWGSRAMWQSKDGGNRFSPMVGVHPFQPKRLKMSNDGVLYVCDSSVATRNHAENAWRYVSDIVPARSSLSANTWTNMKMNCGNSWHVAVPDPVSPGHLCCVGFSNNLSNSTNWGSTNSGTTGSGRAVTGTNPQDPPWLASTSGPTAWNSGDAVFDPLVPNKLWLANGVGVWYTIPSANNAEPTWTSRTAGLDSMTVQRIVKAPAPNGNILIACQDRCFFVTPSPSTFPVRDHPWADGGPPGVQQCGDIIFSDNDPKVVWGSQGASIWRSTDSGNKWNLVGKHGSNYVGLIGQATLASTDPMSCMAAPTNQNEAPHARIQYTADGGKTWQFSQYKGQPLTAFGNFNYGINSKNLVSDGFGNYYYFDGASRVASVKLKDGIGSGALFKSTDGGATMELVSTPSTTGNNAITWGQAGVTNVLACVPGIANHLFYAPGINFGAVATYSPLSMSADGGVTWAVVPSTYYVWQVTFGKAKPGNKYPAIYIAGTLTAYPSEAGVFRCDDYNGTPTMTWTRLDNIKFVNCEGSRSLAGDPEEYGTVYVGLASSGYVVGKIV